MSKKQGQLNKDKLCSTHLILILPIILLLVSVPLTSAMISLEQPFIETSVLERYDDYQYLTIVPGFLGCGESCPITLHKWKKLYKQAPEFKLLFINLDNFSMASDVKKYVQGFNSSFSVLELSTEQRTHLYSQLGYWPHGNPLTNDIDHQALSFVLKRELDDWHVIRRVGLDDLVTTSSWEGILNDK